MKIVVSDELKDIVRAGVLRVTDMTLTDDVWENLWLQVNAECTQIQQQFSGLTAGQVPGVSETRKLYRAVGIEPTKTRPSSEALLRRVIKGKGLYHIHPLVDLFNLVSLKTLLPLGLYDESKIIGDTVNIGLGKKNWSFPGIRKDRVNVEKRLCVADKNGPFGSPTSDSLRTSIEGNVKQALVIFFQHKQYEIETLNAALDLAADLAQSNLGAQIDSREIVSS